MKVFLSWSGSRSKEVAEILGDWLGDVIQAVEPWISSDISKGTRGDEKIATELKKAKVGIICVTPENLKENWIMFEAGALSNTDASVCTFLLDLKPTEIEPPLAQFQHTQVEKKDVQKLVVDINHVVEKVGERSLDAKRLDNIFNRRWPDLEKELNKIVKSEAKPYKEIRSDRELLEEILEIVRRQGEVPGFFGGTSLF